MVADVVRLARTRYGGANHTHLSELLSERRGIDRSTLRRNLVNAELSSPLGEDGPQFILLLEVEDDTCAVVNAVFRPEEDTRGYFTVMQCLIERWGLPLALYGDRHGVFKLSGRPKHNQPWVEATHFSRAMVKLGIQQIFFVEMAAPENTAVIMVRGLATFRQSRRSSAVERY